MKRWDEFFENNKVNEELGEFGIVNINIDGSGFIKERVIDEIKKVLIKFQGERHLFVDGKEINPYDRGGGRG